MVGNKPFDFTPFDLTPFESLRVYDRVFDRAMSPSAVRPVDELRSSRSGPNGSVEWHACFLLILVSLLRLLLHQQAAHYVGLLSE